MPKSVGALQTTNLMDVLCSHDSFILLAWAPFAEQLFKVLPGTAVDVDGLLPEHLPGQALKDLLQVVGQDQLDKERPRLGEGHPEVELDEGRPEVFLSCQENVGEKIRIFFTPFFTCFDLYKIFQVGILNRWEDKDQKG